MEGEPFVRIDLIVDVFGVSEFQYYATFPSVHSFSRISRAVTLYQYSYQVHNLSQMLPNLIPIRILSLLS